MPVYEYNCRKCGTTFEVIQKFSDTPLIVHEGCGGDLEKVLSAPAFRFKGTGWYVTDYAHGKSPSGKPPSNDGESKADKAPPKTDSAPSKPESSQSKPDSGSKPKT